MTFEDLMTNFTCENSWKGIARIAWNNTTKINVIFEGEKDKNITDFQYESYNKLIDNWNVIKEQLVKSVFNYYNKLREEKQNYPKISSFNKIPKMISMIKIIIPLSDNEEKREVAILLRYNWDRNNGIGILLMNEKVESISEKENIISILKK